MKVVTTLQTRRVTVRDASGWYKFAVIKRDADGVLLTGEAAAEWIESRADVIASDIRMHAVGKSGPVRIALTVRLRSNVELDLIAEDVAIASAADRPTRAATVIAAVVDHLRSDLIPVEGGRSR